MLERFPDGARVCFIGDSLTAQNAVQWMTIDCYKSNFPDNGIEFINCGVAGGTATNALEYLEDDVFPHNPTHAVIGFGVNDSLRWDLAKPRSFERYDRLVWGFERFKTNLRKLCDILIERGVKVTLCTPPPYDEYQDSAEPTLVGGFALITAYADEVRNIAREKNLPLCDYFEFIARKMQVDQIHCHDRVHPTDHGYYVMAKHFLSLQGLDVGDYKPMPDYLRDWNTKVSEKVEIYAGELMVVGDYCLPLEEKLKKAQNLLDTAEEGNIYIRFAQNYLKLKPNQEQINADIKELYKKNVLEK
ncbi:MAG: SGNH/GDSL hydrolase family protein [Clostridia bacterium]|nr:SGNH/GDSL hydrolase family protein [Clostridia bacterium]